MSFFHATCLSNLAYKPAKLYLNLLNGTGIRERTRFCHKATSEGKAKLCITQKVKKALAVIFARDPPLQSCVQVYQIKLRYFLFGKYGTNKQYPKILKVIITKWEKVSLFERDTLSYPDLHPYHIWSENRKVHRIYGALKNVFTEPLTPAKSQTDIRKNWAVL